MNHQDINNENTDQLRQVIFDSLRGIGVEVDNLYHDLESLDDLHLLKRLEELWPKLTTVKSFANFLSEELGLGDGRCVIVLIDDSDILLRMMSLHLSTIEDREYLITRGKNLAEGLGLLRYYASVGSLCILVTDIFLDPHDVSIPFDESKSGFELIKQARKLSQRYDIEPVFCVAITSAVDSDIRARAIELADVFIPRENAPRRLKMLISAELDKRAESDDA